VDFHQPPEAVARWPVKWVFRYLLWREVSAKPTHADLTNHHNQRSAVPGEIVLPPGIGG
jgi:hypothetical protein